MREYKFRAWIEKKQKEFDWEVLIKGHMSEPFYFDDFDSDYFIPEGCYLESMIIMQFTDLFDRNGKEIWEGDLLKEDKRKKRTYECRFSNGIFLFSMVNEPYFDLPSKTSKLEVIGNIWESPELLKEMK